MCLLLLNDDKKKSADSIKSCSKEVFIICNYLPYLIKVDILSIKIQQETPIDLILHHNGCKTPFKQSFIGMLFVLFHRILQIRQELII